MRKKVDFSESEHNISVSYGQAWVLKRRKLLIYWNFPTQPSPVFTETGQKKRKY